MARTLFEAIGYMVGKKAAQAKSAFDLLSGTEEESLRAEIRLGKDMARALLERTPLAREDQTTRFAEEILLWLGSHVTERRLPFTIRVTSEPEPNAAPLPGGPIFISQRLLDLCRGERDEIAFVIGHEMAHIVKKHTLDRLVKEAAIHLLLRQSSGRMAVGSWLNQAGRQFLNRAFTKENELEADAFASSLIKRAGGDVFAGERFLERLGVLSSEGDPRLAGTYFSSHPAFAERLLSLRREFSHPVEEGLKPQT